MESNPISERKGKGVLRINDVAGILDESPKEAEEFRKRVLESRKKGWEGYEKKREDIRRRMAQIDWDKVDIEKMRKIFKGERNSS